MSSQMSSFDSKVLPYSFKTTKPCSPGLTRCLAELVGKSHVFVLCMMKWVYIMSASQLNCGMLIRTIKGDYEAMSILCRGNTG